MIKTKYTKLYLLAFLTTIFAGYTYASTPCGTLSNCLTEIKSNDSGYIGYIVGETFDENAKVKLNYLYGATTSQTGVVKLDSSTGSTSQYTAPTSAILKSVWDNINARVNSVSTDLYGSYVDLTSEQNISGEKNFLGNTGIGGVKSSNTRLVIKGSGAGSTSYGINIVDSSNNSLFLVRDDGRIGIGTTNPYGPLEVRGLSSADTGGHAGILNVVNSAPMQSGIGGTIHLYGDYMNTTPSTAVFAEMAGVKENGISGDSKGALVFSTRPGSSLPDEKMRITSDGNIGIGTALPIYQLELKQINPIIGLSSSQTSTTIGANYSSIIFRSPYGSSNSTLGEDASIKTVRSTLWSGDSFTHGSDLIFSSNSSLRDNSSAIERLRITSSGFVGIGTSSPKSLLDISSGSIGLIVGADSNLTSRTDNTLKVARIAFPHYVNSARPMAAIMGTSDSTSNLLSLGGGSSLTNAATQINFYTAPNYGTASDSISARMVIDKNGNVGIGTTAPSEKLQVDGNIAIGNTSSASDYWVMPANIPDSHNASVVPTTLSFGKGASFRYNAVRNSANTYNDEFLTFNTHRGGVSIGERMRITPDGYVGIGTTAPGSILHISSTSANVIIQDSDATLNTNGQTASILFRDKNNTPLGYMGFATTVQDFSIYNHNTTGRLILGTASVDRLIIDGSGNVGIGTSPSYKLHVNGAAAGTSWTNTSDKRLKKNIEQISSALDKVEKLRGVNFEWRSDEFKNKNLPNGKQMGFIAQEVEKVIPEVVTTDGEGYKGVEYANITAVIVEAIKELKQEKDEEINSLRKEIELLKKQ